MEESAHTLLVRLFRDMPDPRMVGKVAHELHDILMITVCAVISGLDHWTQIEDFAQANEAWFLTFLDLPNGIPSHDTFGKVLAMLDPEAFEQRIHALLGSDTAGKHNAIDGKTLRRSFDRTSRKAAIHTISAYVHENHAVFGQLKVDDKTNEITAISKMLELLGYRLACPTPSVGGPVKHGRCRSDTDPQRQCALPTLRLHSRPRLCHSCGEPALDPGAGSRGGRPADWARH